MRLSRRENETAGLAILRLRRGGALLDELIVPIAISATLPSTPLLLSSSPSRQAWMNLDAAPRRFAHISALDRSVSAHSMHAEL